MVKLNFVVHLLISIAAEMPGNLDLVVWSYIAKSLFFIIPMISVNFLSFKSKLSSTKGGNQHEKIIIESYNALSRSRKKV